MIPKPKPNQMKSHEPNAKKRERYKEAYLKKAIFFYVFHELSRLNSLDGACLQQVQFIFYK